jgi:hypothetical protein
MLDEAYSFVIITLQTVIIKHFLLYRRLAWGFVNNFPLSTFNFQLRSRGSAAKSSFTTNPYYTPNVKSPTKVVYIFQKTLYNVLKSITEQDYFFNEISFCIVGW